MAKLTPLARSVVGKISAAQTNVGASIHFQVQSCYPKTHQAKVTNLEECNKHENEENACVVPGLVGCPLVLPLEEGFGKQDTCHRRKSSHSVNLLALVDGVFTMSSTYRGVLGGRIDRPATW
jgi:hypothetical protein